MQPNEWYCTERCFLQFGPYNPAFDVSNQNDFSLQKIRSNKFGRADSVCKSGQQSWQESERCVVCAHKGFQFFQNVAGLCFKIDNVKLECIPACSVVFHPMQFRTVLAPQVLFLRIFLFFLRGFTTSAVWESLPAHLRWSHREMETFPGTGDMLGMAYQLRTPAARYCLRHHRRHLGERWRVRNPPRIFPMPFLAPNSKHNFCFHGGGCVHGLASDAGALPTIRRRFRKVAGCLVNFFCAEPWRSWMGRRP